MNFAHDDPRLSDWVLGELSPEEAAEVEAALAENPALLHEATEIQNLASYLSEHLAPVETTRRIVPFPTVRAPASPIVTVTFASTPARRKSNPWPSVITAAAMLALAALALYKGNQSSKSSSTTIDASAQPPADSQDPVESPTISPTKVTQVAGRDHPAATPAVPDGSLPDANDLTRQLAMEALPESWNLSTEGALASISEVQLPLVVGRQSYNQVRDWIRDRNELPPKETVRVEEIANAFPLPPQQETVAFAGLRVACISMPSPWVEGAQLVGVQIANETRDSRSVSWCFRPGHAAKGIRILASSDGDGKGNSVLPPNQRTLVLLEVASSVSDCGTLVVNSDNRSRRFPAHETMDGGMTQAGLVTAFGLWLRGEGVDDSRLSQILVSAGDDPDPGRTDSRQLIRQALNLAAAKRSKR